MAPPPPSRLRGKLRIYLCRLRTGALLLLFLLVGSLVYLNQVGVPGFIQRPILDNLRSRGLDLQFARLRWRWNHGLVAEAVRMHIGGTNEIAGLGLHFKEVQVRFSHWALCGLEFQVDSLLLRQGRLTLPVATPEGVARELAIEDIQAELRFRPVDLWELDQFRARFAGVEFQLAGALTNASAIGELPFVRAREPAPPGAVSGRLSRLADILEQIHFTSPPQFQAYIFGDARELRSFTIRLNLNAPEANTPWGGFHRSELSLRLVPASRGEPSSGEAWLRAADVQTPWGVLTNLALTLNAWPPVPGGNIVEADLEVSAAAVGTRWGGTGAVRCRAQWSHSFTNPIPVSGRMELELGAGGTIWGGVGAAHLSAAFARVAGAGPPADDSWGGWRCLAPYTLDWTGRVEGVLSSEIEVAQASAVGQWRAPVLQATEISARLYGGRLDARAGLNVATRELSFTNAADFDVRKLAPLLPSDSRPWLANFSWDTPPRLRVSGALILPAWTNRQPDWRGEVKPTLRLDGHISLEKGEIRGVPLMTAGAHFNCTNEVWRLPDLVVTRPEGRLKLSLESDEKTRDFHCRISSTLDPRALRPVLAPPQQRGLDLADFTQPPVIEGEIQGRWHEPGRLGASLRLAATNFSVRGQPADSLQCELEYTNRVLRVIEPRVERAGGTEHMSASRLTADFSTRLIYLTNGFGQADPLAVARAIGPRIGKTIEPYHFLEPPTARVEGVIPMEGEEEGDLHFDVEGGPFECWKFKLPQVSSRLDWVGKRLRLHVAQADFYQGRAWGDAEFDFSVRDGADFHFEARATNSNLHLLMNDLTGTNQIQGVLEGRLRVSHANTTDWQSWQGEGRVKVRDGLIWDMPLFGALSSAMNVVLPGLGNSRAIEGAAGFTITNSVIFSDNLRLQTALMRLKYRGTVDFQGNLDARVEAELLRRTPLIGPLISTVLLPVSKMFIYRVTGTLAKPHSEPLILTPFHSTARPYKQLVPLPEPTPTNGPPATP